MKKIIFISCLFVLSTLSMFSQTADVVAGCSPLTVNFTGINGLSGYYWEFIEGNGTSTIMNPKHIFNKPGTYDVVLRSGIDKAVEGTIQIKVYEEPIVSFIADVLSGCRPLNVNFTSSVTIDPDLTITGYKWSFGDGESSTEEHPTHVYTNIAKFNVTLEITVDSISCNTSITYDEYIDAYSFTTNFSANTYTACDAPHTSTFTNLSVQETDYIYEWDFGNSLTSSEFSPADVIYEEEGEYQVVLTITSPDGCVNTRTRKITVGKPNFDINPPEVVCIGNNIAFENNTNATSFFWTFSEGASIMSSNQENPIMKFNSGGDKTITLKATSGSCSADTSFVIKVEDPDSGFIMDPERSCESPTLLNLIAANDTYELYTWDFINLEDTIYSDFDTSYTITDPIRDSLYWNKSDDYHVKLVVTTAFGCKDSSINIFTLNKPNAHFEASIAHGCAPLNVNFSDLSLAYDPIVKWTYIYGDGQSQVFNTKDDNAHTYNDPGEYYAQIIIETASGCIDTSAGMWIYVGEPIVPDITLDKSTICLGESISIDFNNDDPRIDGYHIDTDDGRYSSCWKDKSSEHTFHTLPGTYPIVATIDYNGCFSSIISDQEIVVNGANADIDYMINCNAPNDVMLSNGGMNASSIIWKVDTTEIISLDDFVHTFDTTGDYKIVLETKDIASGCPSRFDSVIVHIRNIKADFELPEKVCDNIEYMLDASASIDVNNSCHNGFLWNVPSDRPTETPSDSFPSTFPAGLNQVFLIVEDINGCTDTLVKETTSYGIDPKFELDRNKFCLPATINTTNLTESDTTIITWLWDNDDINEETVYMLDALSSNSYTFTLEMEDALGCKDMFSINLPLYEPTTDVTVDTKLCVGDDLNFSATDFFGGDSYLNFNWNLQNYGSYTMQDNVVTADKNGAFLLSLEYIEEGSGCKGLIDTLIEIVQQPIASFTSDVDGDEYICFPRIIGFNSTSEFDDLPLNNKVKWVIPSTTLKNPYNNEQSPNFGRGTHDITLIATSPFGCADTITKSITLVGPVGTVITDKTNICAGETITFELIDTIDVGSFEWDFGDGVFDAENNPVTHQYDYVAESLEVKINLKSKESGCPTVIDIPIDVNGVHADLKYLDSIPVFCNGLAYFANLSEYANVFDWNLSGGEILEDGDTLLIKFPSYGSYDVQLIASSTNHTCEDDTLITAELEEIREIYKIPDLFSPNGDDENDYFKPFATDPSQDKFEEAITIEALKIYNRYGNLIYDNLHGILGWDGNNNGTFAPAEVYGYYMEIGIKGCPTERKQGNVTLMR